MGTAKGVGGVFAPEGGTSQTKEVSVGVCDTA
jgi:hypothetical protein